MLTPLVMMASVTPGTVGEIAAKIIYLQNKY